MPNKKKITTNRPATRVGDALSEALTQQEIVHLLDALFEALSPDLRDQALAKLKPDTRRTVEQILVPSGPLSSQRSDGSKPVSMGKLEQTWSGLWKEWDDIVEEATQEDGEYMEQEASWEQPYFDETAFVEALEQVAKKMRPLIQTAFQNEFSPDTGFAQAVLDATEEVSEGLPEWLEIIDGFYLEAELTTCLLEWEWMKAHEEGQDAFAFARRILDWEDETGNVALQEDVFLDFLTQLPEADQEVLYQGLADSKDTAPWNKYLKNTHSRWNALYMYYAESRAPEQYLSNLLATVSQHWQNGLPVIEDLLAKKDHEQSLHAIEQTLDALLQSHRGGQSWAPEDSLLFPMVSGYYHNDSFKDHKTLLRYYQQTAKGLGHSQLVEILEIQREVFNHFFDWEWMFKTFEETSVPRKIRQALFQSWRDEIIRLTSPSGGFGIEDEHDLWWLDWLIESISDVEKGALWFQKKMDQWLARLPKEIDLTNDSFDYLRLLTRDLTEISGRRKGSYAAFFDVVIEPRGLATSDDKFRLKYLKAYAQAGLLNKVMEYWKKHLEISVPSPRNVHKSDYTTHAQWMGVLKEMAPHRYQALLEEWRLEHHRRKNLWLAMEKMGLG